MYRVMTKEKVIEFIHNLIPGNKVIGVKRKDSKYVFDQIADVAELCLEYNDDTTILPPKKYFFPPKETILKFKLGEEPTIEPVVASEPLIMFGLHPCDLHALYVLDKAFTEKNVDSNYLAKRKVATIMGMDCKPCEYCFCESMGTSTVETGYDLFFTPLNGEYAVAMGTPRGESLLSQYGESREARAEDLEGLKRFRLEREKEFTLKLTMGRELLLDKTSLPMLLEKKVDSPIWSKEAEKCVSCGRCNLVCPTCYCFDVLDEVTLDLTTGERYRRWDGCLLMDFAKVATGENFRRNRADRLKHRFFRKGKYMVERFGKLGCVGCGRCIRACPFKINIVEVFNALRESE